MSFIVRRLGGGTFNPDAICFSPNAMYLFVGLGNIINIYRIPDLILVDQCDSHKAKITALACTSNALVSGDSEGWIIFHSFDDQTIISRTPTDKKQYQFAIEKILVRSDRVFYEYFHESVFWVQEHGVESCFLCVQPATQKQIVGLPSSHDKAGAHPIRFPYRDCFDINNSCTSIMVSTIQGVTFYNFPRARTTKYEAVNRTCICRFINDEEGIAYTQAGQMNLMFSLDSKNPIHKNHWHFQCPNAVTFDKAMIYSGGFEGVLYGYNLKTHRTTFLPRVGRSIEAMVISENSSYIGAIVDKNILCLIDPTSNFVRESVSHITGDISFCGQIAVSVRRPNLVQFFDIKSSKCIEQLQVSSYNSTVPVTHAQLTNDLFITIETAGGIATVQLPMDLQVEFNHWKPHADPHKSLVAYNRLLSYTRYTESNLIKEMDQRELKKVIDLDDEKETELKTVEGNPLVHNTTASRTADYSEIKVWKRGEKSFEIETSFRIVGKVAGPLAVHPVLPVFAVIIDRELQIWKKSSGRWQLWKTKKLPEFPISIIWSPDGTVLLFHFQNRLVIFDAEDFTVAHTEAFSNNILKVLFKNEYEIVVQTRACLLTFDLRSLTATDQKFIQTTTVAAHGDLLAFIVPLEQQTVVILDDKGGSNWKLPTTTPAKTISITKEGLKTRVTVIDQDNFMWSVDQFGQEEIKPIKQTSLPIVQPKQIFIKQRAELDIDMTKTIMDLLQMASHQIPPISELSSAILSSMNVNKKIVPIPVINVDLAQEVADQKEAEVVELSPQDFSRLKAKFAE